jgi:hypothetical protein
MPLLCRGTARASLGYSRRPFLNQGLPKLVDWDAIFPFAGDPFGSDFQEGDEAEKIELTYSTTSERAPACRPNL